MVPSCSIAHLFLNEYHRTLERLQGMRMRHRQCIKVLFYANHLSISYLIPGLNCVLYMLALQFIQFLCQFRQRLSIHENSL